MTDDNLSAILYSIKDLRLEQRPKPIPKDDEVLLRMECVGVCGSDVHYFVNGRIGDFILKKPMVIGHEGSGTVVQIGSKVKNLKIGDRVAIEPGVPCRACNFCKEGRYNLCPDIFFCATPPDDGNLARYYTHAADFCYKLPPHVSLEEGALLEPLSVGVHACKLSKVTVGSNVLILGAGPIGLVSLLSARAYGASRIIVADIKDHKLEVAKTLGADFTLKINDGDTEADVVKKIENMISDKPNITIECSGADFCVRLAILATKTGGDIVMVGMGKPEVQVPLINALAREVKIHGSFRYCNDYADALELVATGKVNVKPLITHHFSMEETLKAFDVTRTGQGNAIKVMIHANPSWKN